MKKLQYIILVGVSGMGKSYWCKENASDDYIASLDDIIVETHPDKSYHEALQEISFKDVKNKFVERLKEFIEKGDNNIVIDNTNLKPKRRKHYLSFLEGKEDMYEKIAIVFPVPDFKEIEKMVSFRTVNDNKFVSEETIKEQINNFVMPTKEEGFDSIIKLY